MLVTREEILEPADADRAAGAGARRLSQPGFPQRRETPSASDVRGPHKSEWDNRITLIYVIGGPARCGKTELAMRLLRAYSLPIFSTDLFRAFMEDLDAGGPQPTTPWSDDDYMVQAARVEHSRARIRLHLSNLMWMVRGVYGSAIFEGVEFLPDDIPRLADRHELRAVFLVRKTVELEALIAHSDRHDWLRHFGQPVQASVMADIVRQSTEIAERAKAHQIAVVDVSRDFAAAMASAAAALGLPLNRQRVISDS